MLRFIVVLLSFSAMADVSFEEKQDRVKLIETLSTAESSINVEGYQRELLYEKDNVDLDTRAQHETNLLAEKVKTQIALAYEAAVLKYGDSELAVAEVKEAIERDLLLADPEMQVELKELSFTALDEAQHGGLSNDVELKSVARVMKKRVSERSGYLNKANTGNNIILSDSNSSAATFKNSKDIMAALMTTVEDPRLATPALQSITTNIVKKIETKIFIQIKFEFLGGSLEAGPVFEFRTALSTKANILAEGMTPVLLSNGTYDHLKRDFNGNPVKSGKSFQKRFINFYCSASLDFESEVVVTGGFRALGAGVTGSIVNRISNAVDLYSGRLNLPETLDGKPMTSHLLSRLCHDGFLGARVSSTMTVRQALTTLMKNSISNFVYTNPKSSCAVDTHCAKWYNTKVISLAKKNNKPRCVENTREKFRSCELRGQLNQACPVIVKKKLVSSGTNEYVCDKGLRCVQTKQAGWIKKAEGRCRR